MTKYAEEIFIPFRYEDKDQQGLHKGIAYIHGLVDGNPFSFSRLGYKDEPKEDVWDLFVETANRTLFEVTSDGIKYQFTNQDNDKIHEDIKHKVTQIIELTYLLKMKQLIGSP